MDRVGQAEIVMMMRMADLVSQFLSSAWLELMGAPWKQSENNSPPSQ